MRSISVWLLLVAVLAACSDTPADEDGSVLVADAAVETGAPDLSPDGSGADSTPPDSAPPAAPVVSFPRSSIQADEMAIIVNTSDPQSVEVAKYYQAKRKIPAANVVKLSFSNKKAMLTSAEFTKLKAQVDAALPVKVQALALTWMKPYQVESMGITSAFALGWDQKYCIPPKIAWVQCHHTAKVKYFMHTTTRPYTDTGVRPAMMLAGVSVADVKKLIDRGVAADGTFPTGKGYMIRTTDWGRSVRWQDFKTTITQFSHAKSLELSYINNTNGTAAGNVIENKKDVLFYFTGLTRVPKITTNSYRPGAVADHLTSFGGYLEPVGGGLPAGNPQMNALRWLEAGLTGSYGTANEPCNILEKFPNTSILLPYYFRGNTLVEAYWKSVSEPGEGVFVGEPLARPWGSRVTFKEGKLTIQTTILQPTKKYLLRGKNGKAGTWETVKSGISIPQYQLYETAVSPVKHSHYELLESK